MSGYQLRRHLEHVHGEPTRGLAYEAMAAIHTHHHRAGADHIHDDPGQGGHLGELEHFLWLVLLVVFILVGLRMLGLLPR